MDRTPETEKNRTDAAPGQVCSTVVDELLAAQIAHGGQVCSTVVDELLAAQLGTKR